MAATVKRDGIRKRRFPQSSTKHALSTPYHLQWPTLKKGGNKIIVNEIVRTLEPLHFEQLCISTKKFLKSLPTEYYDEATALRIQQEQEEKAKKAKLRSSLVIGLNQVTRALEKGTLKLVLVDRAIKPATLLEHLVVLCATRKAPAYAITGMGESAIPHSLGVSKVAAFAFKNIDTPTVFDDLVDFITIMIEPLYVPWLHSRKEEGESPAATNPGVNTADDSDEEHLPGIEEMHKKKRRFKKRKHSQGKKESLAVSLQGVNDSMLHLPSTSTRTAVNVPDTSDSAVNLASTSNSAVNVPGTSESAVNIPVTSNSAVNLPDTSGSTVDIPGTGDFTVNGQGSGNSAVNLQASCNSGIQAQATGNNTVNSQATDDAIINNAKKRRRFRRRSRNTNKKNQNNDGLEYLLPCVKSFDTEKDKGTPQK